MSYATFVELVTAKGWTVAGLRCENAPPSADLLDVIDALGLAKYERFVVKYEKSAK